MSKIDMSFDSGGSGACGDITVSGTGTEFTIDTRLPSITRFMAFCTKTESDSFVLAVEWKSDNPTKYSTVGGASTNVADVGVNKSLNSGSTSRSASIVSVTNGIVIMKAPISSAWSDGTWRWVAV